MKKLSDNFFNQNAAACAKALLGKVLRVKQDGYWLSAQIIETEAYYINDKASHASLGFTPKRKALFMPPGTIYMYYARGGDSLNLSAQGDGNAVLIKSAFPYMDEKSPVDMLAQMQARHATTKTGMPRPIEKLCSGQTLLCKSLGLRVPDWDQRNFDHALFYIEDVGYQPKQIIQTTRLGIPLNRDPHLPLRFVDHAFARFCTKNPLTDRKNNYVYAVAPQTGNEPFRTNRAISPTK